MGKGSLRDKNHRRDRLLGLLRSQDVWTTKTLCRELGISPRTLMRDLGELKEEGYPLTSDRGRGGGLSLDGRWGLERLNLSNQEAISLLLCLGIIEAMTPLGNELGAKSLKQKIANVFPPAQRKPLAELRKRVLIGKLASPKVLETFRKASPTLLATVMQAFFEMKTVMIHYEDDKGKVTQRLIDPQYLLVNWPVWYVLAWDYLRTTVRVFRIDRIRFAESTKAPMKFRPRDLFLDAYEDYFQSL